MSLRFETPDGSFVPGAASSSDADRVCFVAEVSSNHHRDLARCLAFIDRAAEIGCDAVKFQLFRVRELFAPEILARSADHRSREAWELPAAWIPELAGRARLRGVKFGCTPFDLRAVDELVPHVDFLKIASYELTWPDLLDRCASSGLPLVLSTGMANLFEVIEATKRLRDSGCRELSLLHCVSGYPTPPAEANLAALATLREVASSTPTFHFSLGWSDHSVEPGVIHRAVHRYGARMIEFHLDLDGRGEEFAAGHCWLPEQIERVIRDVRVAREADGRAGKRPSPSERDERCWRADPSDGFRPMQSVRKAWQP